QSAPRLWIHRPPMSEARRGKGTPAPPRLELSHGPPPSSCAQEFIGPFRNESLAAQARLLARRVFALDGLRRPHPATYTRELDLAWAFLNGRTDAAIARARRTPGRLLRQVLEFDVARALLPADPRVARYAVLRPLPTGIEGFLI